MKKLKPIAVEECPTCGGTGKQFGITCGDCNGLGVVSSALANKIHSIKK